MKPKLVDPIPSIVLSYKHLNQNSNFRTALMRVFRNNTIPAKTAYWLGRVVKDLEVNLAKIGKEYQEIVVEHAEKDEKGVPIPGDFPGSVKIDKTKEADFTKKREEFEAKTLDLEYLKLPASDFEKAGLTAEDLMALEPLFHGLGGEQ